MAEAFSKFKESFTFNFIEGSRWKYITNGLLVTLKVTFFAVLIGLMIGVVVAMIRSSFDQTKDEMQPGLGKTLMTALNAIAQVYLTVIRGTPVVVQLLIGYFVIFVSSTNTVLVAIMVFGINSGAYITEIIRGGIMSIDRGQFEAGRSIGFNYVQTMRHIIIPQAIKNVLPSLANEFIALMKETAVCGYIGLMDLTKGGDVIRGRTFSAFMPLLAVALIYLILVIFFSWLISKLERRLRSNER
ncbi:MAG: amino acid ABC transporter permease [Eubacteriaceae bacterium]|nr:amino acid ABC transporter permease [Eubacteriaceae bacterium]MBR5995800.1 amino acid ABC transporter permease [Eubacteriaceae bacterium]